MATQEFYIRNESDTEARGPFNLEQLTSLADNGQVTVETLFYDATTEEWKPISTDIDVKAALFPEKKTLKMRAKTEIRSLNQESSDSRPPITVGDILAAAEGRTGDTAAKIDPAFAMVRAAAIGLWGSVGILILAALAEILPSIDFLMAFNPAKLLEHPLVILGLVDVIMVVLLGLGSVSIYPFVRFRAALGLGFLGFLFFTQGMTLQFLAVLAGSLGLFLCTISVRLPVVLVSALIGLAGMGGVAYRLIISE